MNITRIVFIDVNSDSTRQYLATCSIVVEDCLKLTGIRLFRKTESESDYYLVFPSKQDVYKEVFKVNKDIEVNFPENTCKNGKGEKKAYEEFFFPLNKGFYSYILEAIVEGYKACKDGGDGQYNITV